MVSAVGPKRRRRTQKLTLPSLAQNAGVGCRFCRSLGGGTDSRNPGISQAARDSENAFSGFCGPVFWTIGPTTPQQGKSPPQAVFCETGAVAFRLKIATVSEPDLSSSRLGHRAPSSAPTRELALFRYLFSPLEERLNLPFPAETGQLQLRYRAVCIRPRLDS